MAKEKAEPAVEADEPIAEQPVDTVGLVAMTKAGEVIEVHPTCVGSHEAVGWTRKE